MIGDWCWSNCEMGLKEWVVFILGCIVMGLIAALLGSRY